MKRSLLPVVVGVLITLGCFAVAFALAALIAPRLLQSSGTDSPRTMVAVMLALILAARMFWRLRRRRGRPKPPPDVSAKPLSLDE